MYSGKHINVLELKEKMVEHLRQHSFLTANNISHKFKVPRKTVNYVLRTYATSNVECFNRNPMNNKNKRPAYRVKSSTHIV